MDSRTERKLSMEELNSQALETFVYQPVSKQMIAYLAGAAFNVIACDSHLMPPSNAVAHRNQELPPTPPRSPEPRSVQLDDSNLPTLESFITQLVVTSNVQVPTLMSTLVYLTRLKSKLQPMARGLRCTAHRIFLAALILAAKYLNDSSPKNKHWAAYSHIDTDVSNFGFSKSEVNLMERQLLLLLDWNLRIEEDDLIREFSPFLAPIREQIAAKHHQRMVRRRQQEERRLRKAQEEMYLQQQMQAQIVAAGYPTPPASRENSRSRQHTPEHIRSRSTTSSSISPPPLVHSASYGSSLSSQYAHSSADSASIRSRSSRATTPPDVYIEEPYMCIAPDGYNVYESPAQIYAEKAGLSKRKEPTGTRHAASTTMLPYEVSSEELADMQYGKTKRPRFGAGRNMIERMFGAVAVR